MGYPFIVCISLLVLIITFRSVLSLQNQAYTSSSSNLFSNRRNILQTGDASLTVSEPNEVTNPVLTASVTSNKPLDFLQDTLNIPSSSSLRNQQRGNTGGGGGGNSNNGGLFGRSTNKANTPTLPRMSEPQHFGRRETAGIGENPSSTLSSGNGGSSGVSGRYSIPGVRIIPNTESLVGTTTTTTKSSSSKATKDTSSSTVAGSSKQPPLHTTDSSSSSSTSSSSSADNSPFIMNGEEPMKEAAWPILHHFLALLTKGSLDETKLHAPRLPSYLNNNNENEEGTYSTTATEEVEDDDGNSELSFPNGKATNTNLDEEDTNDSYKLSSRKGILDEIYGDDSTSTSFLLAKKKRKSKNKRYQLLEALAELPTFETIRASLSSTSKVFLTASSFNDGIHGPVLRSSLRSIFDNDVESKRFYESFRNEFIVPNSNAIPSGGGSISNSNTVSLQSRQNICNLVPTNPFIEPTAMTSATSSAGIYSPLNAPASINTNPSSSSLITPSTNTNSGTGTGGTAPKTTTNVGTTTIGTAPTTPMDKSTVSDPMKLNNILSVPPPSIIAPSTDAIRDAILKLAENDYRTSVTELLTFFQTLHREAENVPLTRSIHPLKDSTLSPGAAGPSLTLGSSKAVPNVPVLSSNNPFSNGPFESGNTAASSTEVPPKAPLLWLDSHQLPPKPFLALDGRIDIGNQPILVLGSGAGFLSLRLAMGLPNNTIVALSWASKAEGSTIDKETISLPSSVISPSAIHSILKTELGMNKVGNSWIIDTMVEPTIGRLQALITYLRSRLVLDPLQGGWISESMKKASKVAKASLTNTKEDTDDQSKTESSSSNDVSLDDYHLEAIPSNILLMLDGISQKLNNPLFDLDNVINTVYDNNQDVERVSLGTLIIDDLSHLLSSSFTTLGSTLDNENSNNGSFDILPFEFERFLGKLLTLSRHTIIYGSLPDLRFFSYWSSLEALVRASVVAVGMVPTIRSLSNSNNNGNGGTTASTVPSWQGVINNKGSSSVNSNTMGVLVTVQTPLESEYETSLYLRAYEITSSITNNNNVGNKNGRISTVTSLNPLDTITKALSANHMDSTSITGVTIHYCPDTIPRIRKGAIHPSYALMNTVPVDFLLGLGLIRSDSLFLASQMAYLDLPTGLVTSATASDFVIRGSQLLLATDDVPPVTSADFTVSSSASTSPNDVAAALHIRKHAKRTAQAAAKVAEQLATEAAAKKKKETRSTTTKRKSAVITEDEEETDDTVETPVGKSPTLKISPKGNTKTKGKKIVVEESEEETMVDEENEESVPVEEEVEEPTEEILKPKKKILSSKLSVQPKTVRKVASTVTVEDEESDTVTTTDDESTEEIVAKPKQSSLFAKPKNTKPKVVTADAVEENIDDSTVPSIDKLTIRKPALKMESIKPIFVDEEAATTPEDTVTVTKKSSTASSLSSDTKLTGQNGIKATTKKAPNVDIPSIGTKTFDSKQQKSIDNIPKIVEEENEEMDDTISLLAEPGSAAPLPNENIISVQAKSNSKSTKKAPTTIPVGVTAGDENEEAEDYSDLIKPVGKSRSGSSSAKVLTGKAGSETASSTDGDETDLSLDLLNLKNDKDTVGTDEGTPKESNLLIDEEDTLLLDEDNDLIQPVKKNKVTEATDTTTTTTKPSSSILFRGRKLQETNTNNPNSVLFSRNRNSGVTASQRNPSRPIKGGNTGTTSSSSIDSSNTDEIIQDEPLLPYLTDTKWENIRPRKIRSLTSSLSLASSKRLSGWAASVGDAQAELVLQEAPSFRSWWRSLRNELLDTPVDGSRTDSSSSSSSSSMTGPILVHGSGTALLSVKLARMFSQATIVSTKTNEFLLDSGSGTSESEAHADLLRLIGVSNNFIIPSSCSSTASSTSATSTDGYFDSPLFSQATVLALAASRDPFRYALYGNDIWSSFVSTTLSAGIVSQDKNIIPDSDTNNGNDAAVKVAEIIMEQWEEKLSAILRISGTSIFELVPFPRLMAPLAALTPFCEGPCAFLGSSVVTDDEAKETNDSLLSSKSSSRTGGGLDNDGDGFLESIPWTEAQSRASSSVTESFFDGEDTDNGNTASTSSSSSLKKKGTKKPINSIFSETDTKEDELNNLSNNLAEFLEDLLAADESGVFESDTDTVDVNKQEVEDEEENNGVSTGDNNRRPDSFDSSLSGTGISAGRTSSTLFKRSSSTRGRRLIETFNSRSYSTTATTNSNMNTGTAGAPPSRLRGTAPSSVSVPNDNLNSKPSMFTPPNNVRSSESVKSNPAKRTLKELQTFLNPSKRTVARLPRTNKHALSTSEIVLQKYASQTGTKTAFDRLYEPYRELIVAAARRAKLHDIEIRFVIEPVKGSGSRTNSVPPRIFIRVDSWNWAKRGAALSTSRSVPSSISFHTLLTLGVPSSIRARLVRMFLNFPFPSIVRAAEERGSVATMSPLALRLERVPLSSSRKNDDEENTLTSGTECAYTLQYSLPAGNNYDAISYVSSLCLTLPYVSGTDNVYEGTNEISGKLGTLDTDVQIRELWAALASQLIPLDTATGGAKGKFSFVEYGSGLGQISLAVARAFPEATVLSIEDDEENTNAHLAASLRGGILNNIIAKTNLDYNLFRNMHDSPEFFRYQALSLDLSEMLLRAGNERNQNTALSALQGGIGTMFATAATSFVRIPPAAALSLAFTIFTDSYPSTESGNGWVIPTDIHTLGSYTGRYIQNSLYSHSKSTVLGLRTAFSPSIFESDKKGSDGSSVPYVPWSTLGSNNDKNDGGFTALINALEENDGRTYRASFSNRFALNVHPRPSFVSAELRLLSALVRAPSGTSIRITAAAIPAIRHVPDSMDDIVPSIAPMATVSLSSMNNVHRGVHGGTWKVPVLLGGSMSSGLVRVDIANLTRHVNHHFQSDIDGHSRKYTLHVQANYTAGGYIARYLADKQLTSLHELVSGGTSASGTYIDDIYNLLPPGNHPNFGHTIEYNGYGACAALANEASKRAEEDTEAEMKLLKKKGPKAQEMITIAMQEAADRVFAECTLDDNIVPQSPSIGEIARALSLPTGTVYPGVSSIILTRDFDNAFIPYDSVHGITLISGLRLGLLPSLRSRAYHQFVSLPLYQDMAPWNIVFLGPKLDYIDYDTRDHTYDAFVPKAYEVMEVLFNYKRTVEDFKKCNGKSGNPYNFPFVSDCVASTSAPTCKDSARPVPCGDGTCRSDYISCLRAISENDRTTGLRKDILWAFRTYAKTQANDENDNGDTNDSSGNPSDLSSTTTGNDIKVDTPENYLSTLFGINDRSRGTAADTGRKEDKDEENDENGTVDSLAKRKKKAAVAAAAAEARRRQKRSEGGGTKLGPGHEFLSPGGSLEYTVDGIKRK